MQEFTNATNRTCYRLLYLAGMIRTAKAMVAGSDHKKRCLLLFYAVKYFEAVKVEGITPEEVEQLQGFRNLLSDVLIGTIKQADLIRLCPLSLKGIEKMPTIAVGKQSKKVKKELNT